MADEAERLAAPMLDNRAVTDQEMCTGPVEQDLPENQLQSHRRNLQTHLPPEASTGTDVSKYRLASFLSLHVVSFSAQIAAMINFALTSDYFFLCFLLLPFLFSGIFCAHAAWYSNESALRLGLMPLKDWPPPVAMILAVPLGLFQLVIVHQSIDEYLSSNDHVGHARPAGLAKPPSNRFHCKAVNGIFEGILSSAVLLYAYWSLDFPQGNEITKSRWTGEKQFLATVGLVAFFQSGIGLLELDFCTSKAISKRMHKSLVYEFVHFLFRVCEVTSRVSIFIGFMVNARQKSSWWWVPLAAEFAISTLLVAVYGGAEKTWLVRILCAIPCAFANPFLFIDSPQKRWAAAKLSRRLTIRHAAELIVLPVLLAVSVEGVDTDVKAWWSMHVGTNVISAIAIPLYWVLLVYITWVRKHVDNMTDIFSACEKGSQEELDKAMAETRSNVVGLNINCFDVEGRTPLMYAAVNGHDQVCRSLLRKGAKVDIRIFRRLGPSWRSIFYKYVRLEWTAVHMAAHKGQTDVVRELMDEGTRDGEPIDAEDNRASRGSDNFIDTQGNTPLHVAASSGHTEVARVLATRQPEWVDLENRQGKTPGQLAQSEPLKQAIRESADGGENGRRSSSLSSSLPHQPSLRSRRDQPWPMINLVILRLEDDLSAPGLCSYITSSGGGALGRVFLAKEATPNSSEQQPRNSSNEDGRLPLVSSASANVVAEQDPADIEPIDENGNTVSLNQRTSLGDSLESCCFRADPSTDANLANKLKFEMVLPAARLGQGTYGIVWRAKDRKNNNWYAIKNINAGSRGASDIAIRDRAIAEHISVKPHPCIVYLYKTIFFGSFYSMIMEFCPGGDLLKKISEARERAYVTYTPPRLARNWLGQIFLGLEHMHKRMNTLLRDLKPDNCVVSSEEIVKLTDFGFGRFGVESQGNWSFGCPAGSPGYIAPEGLRRRQYNAKADLYSLGVVAWVLLTGGMKDSKTPHPPFSQRGGTVPVPERHFYDCQKLLDCIENPQAHEVVPLAEQESRDFVKRLTDEEPARRMDHDDIRAHEFMAPLQLPEFTADIGNVKTWLSGIGGRGA